MDQSCGPTLTWDKLRFAAFMSGLAEFYDFDMLWSIAKSINISSAYSAYDCY